jgi:general secretion pathway protein L
MKQGIARRRRAGNGATGFIAGAGFEGLLAWWRRQLEAVLPGWAQRGLAPRDAIIIDVWRISEDPDAALPASGQIVFRRSGRSRIAAPLDLAGRQIARSVSDTVILRLPEQLILRREITLPIASERNLRSIIDAQMDRLTPFAAADVFWAAAQLRRDDSRLRLTLHVVPRSRIAGLLGRLAEVGLEPSILEVGQAGIRLARLGRRKPRRGAARFGLLAALALGCVLVPLISQQNRLRATQQRLAALLPVQRQIIRLQAQIADQTAVQSLQQDSILPTLARLSAALPDGTWLSDISVTGNRVGFDGESNNAAQLVLALSAMPGFRNVGFSAPVTRAPGGGDIFSIQLSVSK